VTIQAITSLVSSTPLPGLDTASQAKTAGFADMLVEGAESADKSIRNAEQKIAAFAAGENIPPHQVMMALEDARMSFQLALQVRSKLVEGLQELMRMQL
jgi:flagellar hook-basal body complex protein FliE